MREVGDGFSEEGTEVRTQDKEKLVTWCAGETAAAPAVHDLTTGDTIWARLGLEAGCWQRAGVEARGQRSFRLQEGVCILYDENPLKELKHNPSRVKTHQKESRCYSKPGFSCCLCSTREATTMRNLHTAGQEKVCAQQ